MLRQEAMLATIAGLICVAGQIKNKTTQQPMTATDFMPWAIDAPEPLSFEDAVKQFGVISGL